MRFPPTNTSAMSFSASKRTISASFPSAIDPFLSYTFESHSSLIYLNNRFGEYSKLKEVTLTGDNISLYSHSFYCHHNLEILNLPEKIKYIAPDVFNKTTIKKIRYAGDEKTWNELIKDVNKADLAKINVTFGKK